MNAAGADTGDDRGGGMRPVPAAGSRGVHRATTSRQAESGQAFARFVEPEVEVLLRVAKTLTGSWADAEDLVQDTLIRAFRGIDRFDGAHPRAWLLTILRNTNINSHRRQRPELLDADAELDRHRPAFGTSEVSSPENIVADRALGDELQAAVDALDGRFRIVLLLVDVDDLTYREVAEVLGIPVGTVLSRLSRARNRVRTQLRTNPRARRTP